MLNFFVVFASIILCIIFSAFFSSSEMAFSAANQVRLENISEDSSHKDRKKAKRALKLVKNYDSLLSSILIGNNLVNIASSSLSSVFVILITGKDSLTWIGTFILTVLIILFGETIPKIKAKHSATRLSMSYSSALKAIDILFKPITFTVVCLVKLFCLPFRVKKSEKSENSAEAVEELQTIIETAEDEGVLDSTDKMLLQNAIDFADISASEAMTARVDVQAIDIDNDWKAVLNFINSTPYSRIPVYKESIDNIIGIIHLNRFLQKLIENEKKPFDLNTLLMKPCFVYKTMKLPSVLNQLKQAKQHLAIVTDEYSGTLGVITMEDVLEQVVGEIWDETDIVEKKVINLSDSSWLIDGDMPISEFIELVNLDEYSFDCESETVGGWTIEMLDHFPDEGESFESGNLRIAIQKTDKRRVAQVLISKLS